MGAPLIGVIAADTVAQTLTRFGFQVVTDDEPRAAATAISHSMRQNGAFRLIVADTEGTAQLSAWVVSMAERTKVAVIPTDSGTGILAGQPQRLNTGATLNDLFAVLGYAATDRTEGNEPMHVGQAAQSPAFEPVPIPEPSVESDPIPEPVAAPSVPPAAAETPQPASQAPAAAFPDEFFVHSGKPELAAAVASATQPDGDSDEPSPQPDAAEPVVAPELEYTPVAVPLPEPMEPELAPVVPQVATPAPALPVQQQQPVAAAPVTPPAAPERVPAVPAAPAPSIDDDFFQRRMQTHTSPGAAPAPVRPAGNAQVIVVGSGKGGVGKSTTSILLADAASRAGLRAVLIDANRGQADLRKYLRLGDQAVLPTAYDVAAGADPAAAIVSPAQYGPLRQAARLDVPDFAIVLGPPTDLADPRYASAAVYGAITDHARQIADVVIVDTQIVEAHRTDLWEHYIVPLLRSGAWLVGITDESSPGVSNLLDRLSELAIAGVSSSSTVVLATRYEDFTEEDSLYFQTKFGSLGTFIGATGNDDSFRDQMNMGRIVHDSPAVAPAIRAILNRVTGRSDLFAPLPPREERRRPRLFGRR